MKSVTNTTRQLLTYALLPGIGPQTLRALSDIPLFWEHSPDELAQRIPLLAKALLSTGSLEKAKASAHDQLEQCEQTNTQLLSRFDAEYPALLAQSPDDPTLLWVKGTLPKPSQPTVAVIGARAATEHGLEIAGRITRHLVEQNYSIVSGLAVGIDAASHTAALDAYGHTVAVLAHGLQTVAPKENLALAERILVEGGALVSEYPFGRAPRGHQYVQRDRTQAGLSQGVVMVQTDLKGGSLHATRAALSYGRWVAVPYPTEYDLSIRSPKIQANLVIASGTNIQRMKLLRCNQNALSRVRILRSRDDYECLQPGVQPINDPLPDEEPQQGSFFIRN